MEIRTCPNCRIDVVATATGQCPSCRKPMAIPAKMIPAKEPSSNRPRVEVPPVVMSPSGAVGKGPGADITNPYLAPPEIIADRSPFASYDAQNDRSLVWALFRFSGRIPRRTYWGLILAASAVYYCCFFALLFIFGAFESGDAPRGVEDMVGILILPIVGVFLWVSVALQVKRWHDRDKSGWWVFINLIPLVGPLVSFVELGCLRGTYGPNQYGPDPT